MGDYAFAYIMIGVFVSTVELMFLDHKYNLLAWFMCTVLFWPVVLCCVAAWSVYRTIKDVWGEKE